MNRRARITKRGPTSPSISCDEECEEPVVWRQVAIGVAATLLGSLMAPSASRAGDWLADRLFGSDEFEDEEDVGTGEAVKTELKKNEDS